MNRAAVFRVLLLGVLALAVPLSGLSLLESLLLRPSGWVAGLVAFVSVALLLALLVAVANWMWRETRGVRLSGRSSRRVRLPDAGLFLLLLRGLMVFTVLGVGLELARVTTALVMGWPVPEGGVLSGVVLMVTLLACSVLEVPGRINADGS